MTTETSTGKWHARYTRLTNKLTTNGCEIKDQIGNERFYPSYAGSVTLMSAGLFLDSGANDDDQLIEEAGIVVFAEE